MNSTSAGAQSCYDAWQTYNTAYNSAAYMTSTVVDYTTFTKWTSNNDQVPVTTLCDGYPRYLGSLSTGYTVVTITPTPTSWATLYNSQGNPPDAPNCTISPEDCKPFMDARLSSLSAWSANKSNPYPTETMPCSTYIPCPTRDLVDGDLPCQLYADDITVWYWPVSTTGDFCGPTPTID